jgi:hypothetical protein
MTFGPWICSRIVVFVPATKKRRRTSLSSSFFFGLQVPLSTPPFLPSLAARSGLDDLAARAGALGKTLTEFLNAAT